MAYNNQQQSFWDWAYAFNNNGAGVDHPAEGGPNFRPHPHPPPPHPHGFAGLFGGPFAGPNGGPFGGPRGGGFGGHRGRHWRRDGSHERRHGGDESHEHSEGEREGSPHPHEGPHSHGHHGRGRHGRRGGWGGPGHRGPPPPVSFPGALAGLLEALSGHPLAMAFQNFAAQAAQQSGETGDVADPDNSFTPPIDVFSTPSAYVLHVALPGAKKEDVGVHWDTEKRTLNLAGVVYRQGDEEFLKTLTQSERKVGEFERAIKLPPGTEEKEEVDGDAITAKLEDGVLVVTVPKLPKDSDWTEVKRVDVQ